MTLRLVGESGPASTPSGPRTPSPDAGGPPRAGTVPLALARLLQRGEPVIWWGEKKTVHWKVVGGLAGAGAGILALASLVVPELWSQPWRDVLRTVLLTQLPAAALLAREWLGRRAVIVTDTAIAHLRPNGAADRIAFRNVRVVRRDWLSGGVILRGKRHEVRIPPALLEDTRAAIASQMSAVVDMGGEPPDDALGWLPRPGR